MKEIKFRAWIPSEKTMIGHRETIERAHLQFNDSLNASDIVMQFTGLHDRNGKEIYESDINQDGGIVFWNNNTASFDWEYPNGDVMPFEDEPMWCEIKGNKYENPELL